MFTKSHDNLILSEDQNSNTDTAKRKTRQEYKKVNNLLKNKRIRYDTGRCFLNHHKNRYYNVLPNDDTRVKLNGSNDYINANHILYNKYHYISTQAPLVNTKNDFWQMVWEQKSSVVVMLTDLKEYGQEKAICYWDCPHVEVVKTITIELAEIRYIKLMQGDESRIIYHIKYNNWSDYQKPSSVLEIKQLIGYMEIYSVLGAKKGLSGPPVIHCSAGIGRSGTFITCCIVKNLKLCKLPVSISNIVAEIRKCRGGMVQTVEQYCFIHKFYKLS